jgi:TPR repeat protein
MPKSLVALLLAASVTTFTVPLTSSAEANHEPLTATSDAVQVSEINLHAAPPSATLLAQAKAGNVKAQFRLADYYYNQSGLDMLNGLPHYMAVLDMNRCRFWAQKSAGSEYPPAEEFLGMIYLLGGPGLAHNCSKALPLIKKSAAGGYVPAEKLLNMPSLMGRCDE